MQAVAAGYGSTARAVPTPGQRWGRGACVFPCKVCREVARLVGEVAYLRQKMDSIKKIITGQGLEVERGETGDQVVRLEETEEKEKCERVMTPGNCATEENRKGKETEERSSSEDRGIVIEIEGERGTEGDTREGRLKRNSFVRERRSWQ